MEDNILIRADIPEGIYSQIPAELRREFSIVNVEPKDYDYSENEAWKLARSESVKAFKKQKLIEFNIRKEWVKQ